MGRAVSAGEFAAICLALEKKGAENINLVTGSHAVPALLEGIRAARGLGLSVPVLWNSSAYESREALDLLADVVDVYLPDLKTVDREVARRFFLAPDYPEQATAAILRMLENRGRLEYRPPAAPVPATVAAAATAAAVTGPGPSAAAVPAAPAGVLVSGVIVRHLVLPGYLEASRDVIRWFAEHARGKALLSLMTQYTPVKPAIPANSVKGPAAGGDDGPPRRYVNAEEYGQVCRWLEEYGIEEGFYQELSPDSGWLPDFNRPNPFSSELSLPVWHWREGMVGQGDERGESP
jgi:putative pyruvate formate lyase activating enzyme